MVGCAVGLAGQHVGTIVGDGDFRAARKLARPEPATVTVQTVLHAVGVHGLTGVLVVPLADNSVPHGHGVGGAGDGNIDSLLAGRRGIDCCREVHVCGLKVTVAAEGCGDVCGDLTVEAAVGDVALTDGLFVGSIEGGGLEGHLVQTCGNLQALAQCDTEGRALGNLLAGVVHVDTHGRTNARLVVLAGGTHAVDLNAAGGGRGAAVVAGDVVAGSGGGGGGSVAGSVVGRCERRCCGLGDNAQAREREERDGLREGRALGGHDRQSFVSFCVDGGGGYPLAPCFRGKPIYALSVFQAHFLVFVELFACKGCENVCFATKSRHLMY